MLYSGTYAEPQPRWQRIRRNGGGDVGATEVEGALQYQLSLDGEPSGISSFMHLHMDTSQSAQEAAFDIDLADNFIAEVRVRQYTGGDEYYDALEWTTISESGTHEMLIPVDKGAVGGGQPTMLELRVSTQSGTAFEDGTNVFMRNYYIKVASYKIETKIVTICDDKDNYRFGFNGQEKDNEVRGIGNTLDFKFRSYDSRLGRFMSIDPLARQYPWNSTYAFAENDVIRCLDLEGAERYYSQDGTMRWSYGDNLKVMLVNDDYVKANQGNRVSLKELNANSRDVGMNQPELNSRAFLTMIRKGEGTLGMSGYSKMFSGVKIKDMSDHPNKVIKASGYSSSAAGAYQVLSKTWNGKAGVNARKDLGITDFSPESQDKFGLWLLKNRGALGDITNGNVRGAILKTNKEWASLPESPYGQPTQTMEGAEGEFKEAVSNELQGKSDIATPQGELETTINQLK